MSNATQISHLTDGHISLVPNDLGFAETILPEQLALIDLIGLNCFFEDLASALTTAVGFEGFHTFLYQTDAAPMNLVNRPNECKYKRGLENFLNYTYVINPVFRAFHVVRRPVFIRSQTLFRTVSNA